MPNFIFLNVKYIFMKKNVYTYHGRGMAEWIGHQESKSSKYIGLKRVSPYILNSMYGIRGGYRKPSQA